MCGIFGVISTAKVNLDKAEKALNELRHRGPDASGYEMPRENVYLGHRRLSILDLSENGKQPMLHLESGVVLTINGEIYNFRSIKDELKGKYRFRFKNWQ